MWFIVAFLLVLWLVAMLTGIMHGWFVHLLVAAAVILLVYQLARGRGPR